MRGFRPGFRIFTLFLALLGGQVLAAVVLLGVFGVSGSEDGGLGSLTPNRLRSVLFISQFLGFLIPGLVLVRLWDLRMDQLFALATPRWVSTAVIILYFGSLPLFSWAYLVNVNISVPDWWPFAVEAVPEEIFQVLSQEGWWALLANLATIGLLPAVAEELVFRGLLQPQTQRLMGSDILGIMITALFFSLIHLDFQGILPRWILGLVLGFAYFYSRSLIWPILIHFIHNGGQVLISYFYTDFMEIEREPVDLGWSIWPILSGIAFIGLLLMLHKKAYK